jgi:hypothetical protein
MAELALQFAGGDGLGSVGLPAGAGEVVLDLRGEGAEADDEQQPPSDDELGVVGDPDAEPTQWAGLEAGREPGVRVVLAGVAAGGRRRHGVIRFVSKLRAFDGGSVQMRAGRAWVAV